MLRVIVYNRRSSELFVILAVESSLVLKFATKDVVILRGYPGDRGQAEGISIEVMIMQLSQQAQGKMFEVGEVIPK